MAILSVIVRTLLYLNFIECCILIVDHLVLVISSHTAMWLLFKLNDWRSAEPKTRIDITAQHVVVGLKITIFVIILKFFLVLRIFLYVEANWSTLRRVLKN